MKSHRQNFSKLNDKGFEVELKVQNDVVRVEVQNASAQISTSVKKSGNTVVMPCQQMRYDFSDICNLSNVPLDSFFWHDELPGAVRLDVIHTGDVEPAGNDIFRHLQDKPQFQLQNACFRIACHTTV